MNSSLREMQIHLQELLVINLITALQNLYGDIRTAIHLMLQEAGMMPVIMENT